MPESSAWMEHPDYVRAQIEFVAGTTNEWWTSQGYGLRERQSALGVLLNLYAESLATNRQEK